MNERIQELSVEAWRFTSNEVAYLNRIHNRSYSQDEITDIFEQKFAELVVAECIDAVENSNDRYRRDYFAEKIRERFGVNQ